MAKIVQLIVNKKVAHAPLKYQEVGDWYATTPRPRVPPSAVTPKGFCFLFLEAVAYKKQMYDNCLKQPKKLSIRGAFAI